MNCSVCNKVVEPVRIGTSDYCPDCGSRLHDTTKLSAKPRSMDIHHPAKAPAHTPPAVDLDSRAEAARAHVLDLRKSRELRDHNSLVNARSAVAGTIRQTPEVIRARHQQSTASSVNKYRRSFGRFEDRFQRAMGIPRSGNISKYATAAAAPPQIIVIEAPAAGSQEAKGHSFIPPGANAPKEMPAAIGTHHETLSKLLEVHKKKEHESHRVDQHTFGRPGGRVVAALGIIAVMGGYIWLQNAPKLAIQSAGAKAGITAAVPTYVPSSYSLNRTDTAPGLVTLSFTSPSAADTLRIAQQKTNWDSHSLLDNFVSRQSGDYTAVEGQGLTIYLFGQNQATWVNHGLQYTIEGAGRLSREQVLKIAYSL